MTLYALGAALFGTAHLTFAAAVAPLFLLRSKHSIEFALRHTTSNRTASLSPSPGLESSIVQTYLALIALAGVFALLLPIILYKGKPPLDIQGFATTLAFLTVAVSILVALTVYTLAPVFMRIIATLNGLLASPAATVKGIPGNWWSQVLCLDSLHPPEVLPGSIDYERRQGYVSELQPFRFVLEKLRIRLVGESLISWKRVSAPIYFALLAPYLLAAIPAYIYRFSLKGTSLLLAPMIWLTFDAMETKPEHFIKSTLVGGVYKGSLAVITLAVGALAFAYFGTDFGMREHLTKSALAAQSPRLAAFFPANEFTTWQGVLTLNALAIVATFHFAERMAIRGETPSHLRVFRALMVLVGVLAVVLIYSLLYTAASAA